MADPSDQQPSFVGGDGALTSYALTISGAFQVHEESDKSRQIEAAESDALSDCSMAHTENEATCTLVDLVLCHLQFP